MSDNREARIKLVRDLVRTQAAPDSARDVEKVLADMRAYICGTLGLPDSDAVWFHGMLYRNHWKISGVLIHDWKSAADSFHNAKYFKSQRR